MVGVRSQDHDVLGQLRKELRALKSGPLPAWPRIGRFLDDVESWRFWETEQAPSFSHWLRTLALSLGRKERILWRYLSAARFYQEELPPLLKQWKVAAPPLTELPEGVNAENLELLAKLSRVAPEEVMEPLARRVVQGEISRAELTRVWQTFGPVLGGRTARGRFVVAPRIDREDPDQKERQLAATVYHALQLGGEWTGYNDLDLYEVFLEVRPPDPPGLRADRRFDAVAVVRHQGGQPEIHGIEAKGFSGQTVLGDEFAELAKCCDFVWFARPEAGDTADLDSIPQPIGLLRVRGVSVDVVRPAARITHEVSCRESLLGSLLARAIRV
jgi:hypothetical protein